jgi:Flp pilus assembly protein TadD
MPPTHELVAAGRKALAARDGRAAVTALKAALAQSPRDPSIALLLAQALERDGQFVQAQKAWLWVASQVRAPLKPLRRAVALSLRRGDLDATAKLLRSITQQYPRLLTFRVELARLELGRGQANACREVALQLVDEAQAAGDPSLQAEGHLLAGLASVLGSKLTFAEKHLLQARDLAPDVVEPWLALASVRVLKKDRLRAEQLLLEAVQRFPKAFGPANNLGLLYLKTRDRQRRQKAIPLLERAALNAPQNKDVYLNLALAWYPRDAARARWCAQKALLSKRPATQRAARRLLTLLPPAPGTPRAS